MPILHQVQVMRLVDSISDVFASKSYSTLAIDVYGVLHDGEKLFPYSHECLKQLSEAGIRTILLSNSSRLGPVLARDLERKFGIQHCDIVSSGDMTRIFLHDSLHEDTENCVATVMPGKTTMTATEFKAEYIKTGRFFLLGNDDYHGPLYKPLAPALERAVDWKNDEYDFVLLGAIIPLEGPFDPFDGESVEKHYKPFLDHCLKQGLPLVCANPDVWAPNGKNPDGSMKLLACPGYIGELYQRMGGKVLYFGKPFPSIYKYLLLGVEDPKSLLCIGDNVATDVMGAREEGLDVAMIMGGVHSDLLLPLDDPLPKIKQLCSSISSKEPNFVMPLLKYK